MSTIEVDEVCADELLVPSLVKVCKKCGTAERYKDGRCKVCRRAALSALYKSAPEKRKAARKEAYKLDPERYKKSSAAYRLVNPDSIKKADIAWRKANQDRARQTRKVYRTAWRKANPELVRIQNQNRRSMRRKAGGVLSKGLVKSLFKLQQGKCACCKLPLGDNYHLDHIMPLALGGSNTDDNMQLLRQRCNGQKGAKDPICFMQERGFLL